MSNAATKGPEHGLRAAGTWRDLSETPSGSPPPARRGLQRHQQPLATMSHFQLIEPVLTGE